MAVSVVYGGIQQGSLFAKEYGKCRLNAEVGSDDGMMEMCFRPTAVWMLHDKIEAKTSA